MANTNEERWRLAQRAEKELHTYVTDKNCAFPDIAHLLTQYRTACENLILQDFEFAFAKDAENRLWDAHGKIKNRFGKELKHFRETAGKRKPVEERKLVKHFLDFIKSGQHFYRGYIQRLASRFDGVRELETVANRLTLSTLSADEPTQVSGALAYAILLSCHQTLVRLGDLSRWRETQCVTKNRNWGPAIGYYNLAGLIHHTSGVSHNQLAVIAQVDVNHLSATYHLYRALAVEEPHPSAKANLEIEFKKIEEAWSKGDLIKIDPVRNSQEPGKALVGWFMRLHARCYKGLDFLEHEELESEVLSQLAVDLKERSFESTLNKLVMINIAAESFAGVRLQESGGSAETLRSFFFLQRLNVSTFFALLQVLLPELERSVSEDVQSNGIAPSSGSARITAVTRRVLPALRQYSSWLISNAKILAAQVGDNVLNVQVRELWKIYATTLTLLTSTFPVSDLPLIEYLLDEDEDTVGFKPLDNENTKHRYYNGIDLVVQKPRYHDRGIQRHHPNVEMLGRVRDLLTDGMLQHSDDKVPIKLVDVEGAMTFTYVEEGMQEEESYHAPLSLTRIELEEVTHVDETTLPDAPASISGGASQAASISVNMDAASKRMVDNLVDSETTDDGGDAELIDQSTNGIPRGFAVPGYGPSPTKYVGDETSYGLIGSSTAREHFGDLQDPVTHSPRPLIPSITNSPFALQPGEKTPGSQPSTSKRKTPGHSKQNSQTRFPQPMGFSLDSSPSNPSTMPDPTPGSHANGFYHNQHPLNNTLPSVQNYTRGPLNTYGHNALQADEPNFLSLDVFEGSTWGGGSGQSGRMAANVMTPPNGQGAG